MMRAFVIIFLCAFCQQAPAQGVAVDSGWLTVKDVSLMIKPGSPLDFSVFFPEQAAGVGARVQANAAGGLSVGDKPTRFLCASMNLTPPYGGFPSEQQADLYALQLRRAGYNLVRMHHIDSTLMTGRQRDFDYDPEQLRRFQYFLAALKKQGIYWMLDLMSSENGAYGNVTPHRWVNRHDLKLRVYVENAALEHWRRLVETLYGRINPYTGLSILADPALLGVNTVNEGGLQFLVHVNKAVSPILMPALVGWLRARYPDRSRFEAVWKQPGSNLLSGALTLPTHGEMSERSDDLLAFYDSLQEKTGTWMAAQLKMMGYEGLVTAFNNMPTTHATRSRRSFPLVDMHAYHDEAFGFEPGSRMRNDSSFDKNLRYIADLATARLAGKPFVVSEYGQPFWNAWRREAALVGPGYAAFQGWDAICQHASTAVDLTYAHVGTWKQSIIPYAVGLDPVGRAVETLAALLYRRGDVSTGNSAVEIELPGGEAESTARYWGVPSRMARTAFVSRIAMRLPEQRAGDNAQVVARLTVEPESQIGRKLGEWFSTGRVRLGSGDQALDGLAKLQKPDSATRAAAGVFESSTGELLARMPSRRFEVRTPRTRGIVFETLDSPWSLGPLRLTSADQPSLVALSSLDGNVLADSKDMLMIIASDALNTDMRFKDASRQELVSLGRLPARVAPRNVVLVADKRHVFRITALSARGEKLEEVAFDESGDGQVFSVGLSTSQSGATFYFQVERLQAR